jgi:predicted CopG family antitoxin
MGTTFEIDDDLQERLDVAREEGESYEELIEELVTIYENEGAFLREGYSE